MSYAQLQNFWQENNAQLIAKYPENDKSGLSFNVVVDKKDIVNFSKNLLVENWFLEDIGGADFLEGFLVSYHFASFTQTGRICLRVLVDKNEAKLPSISSVYHGAQWHERETFDFYGLIFEGNPNLVPLLLDNNHQGLPPLLKEEKDLASLADVDFFTGEIQFLNSFWEKLKPIEKTKEKENLEKEVKK